MACQGFLNVLIDYDGKLLIGQTDLSYSASRDMIETSAKDSLGWKEFCAGLAEMTISVTQTTGYDTSGSPDPNLYQFGDFIDKMSATDPGTFEITLYESDSVTPVPNANKVSGTCWLETDDGTFPLNDQATTSLTLRVTGKPTLSQNPTP